MQHTLNDDWAASHPTPPKSVIRTQRMIARYGPGPEGKRCKTCKHLTYTLANKKFFKCLLYGNTASVATDWRCTQEACGRYEEENTNAK